MNEIHKKQIKIDFKKDLLSNKMIPLDEFRKKIKVNQPKRKTFFLTEIADLYYKEMYSLNIVQVLSKFYEIPKCPITGNLVSYRYGSAITLGIFSSDSTKKERNNYIALNNENFKKFCSKLKAERAGKGNPMYGKNPWNKGLTKETNESMRVNSEKRIGRKTSEESKIKQSISAKKRKIHGHTGLKHSEASKQLMRENTIRMLKNKEFPQTNTVPHKKIKELLEKHIGICHVDFEEEFEYGYWAFDFKVGNILIEVQGDFWHCNPNTRHAVPKTKSQNINLGRDKNKKNYVLKYKQYELIVFWENDIINNINHIEECIKNLKK